MSKLMTVEEVMEELGVKQAKAYQIIRQLNQELDEQGVITVSGRVNREYFDQRTSPQSNTRA